MERQQRGYQEGSSDDLAQALINYTKELYKNDKGFIQIDDKISFVTGLPKGYFIKYSDLFGILIAEINGFGNKTNQIIRVDDKLMSKTTYAMYY